MDHMTAKVSCFARAYHHKHNETHIFDDNAAERLLGEDYEQISKNMTEGLPFFFPDFEGTKEEGLRLIVDRQLSPSVLARSAYCENKLMDEKNQGCRQYLIFASGYDTFSLRNTDESFSVFELDLPEMIADKRERIEKQKIKSTAVSVPCNLAEESWKEQLLEAGYSQSQKAFGSLLGLCYYLRKEEFERLLMGVNEIMAEGSVICFDYPSADESRETKTNQSLAQGAGEQMKALYSEQEIKALLQKCGFKLKEHLKDHEMTELYFKEYNNGNPAHQMQAPMGVGYVFAEKIRRAHS